MQLRRPVRCRAPRARDRAARPGGDARSRTRPPRSCRGRARSAAAGSPFRSTPPTRATTFAPAHRLGLPRPRGGGEPVLPGGGGHRPGPRPRARRGGRRRRRRRRGREPTRRLRRPAHRPCIGRVGRPPLGATCWTGSGALPGVRIRPADLATFIYTGGTTGLSKGCMLSHNYHEALARQIGICWRRTADDVVWTPLPHVPLQRPGHGRRRGSGLRGTGRDLPAVLGVPVLARDEPGRRHRHLDPGHHGLPARPRHRPARDAQARADPRRTRRCGCSGRRRCPSRWTG